jgi:hypothetical protein
MGAGRKTDRTGLLIRITLAVLFLFSSPLVFSQDTAKVFIEINSQTAAVGIPWILTLIVNHGDPDEVSVISPPFAPFLSVDRIFKSPGHTGARAQTAVEYSFTPNAAGSFSFGSFTVITPAGSAKTEPFVLEIRPVAGETKPFTPRVVWEGAPAQMAAGERATLTLRVHGWNSQQPPPEFFLPEVPKDVILSPLRVTSEERTGGITANGGNGGGGIALKLTLIPLKAGNFTLPARVIQYENVRFEIPALHIRITGG